MTRVNREIRYRSKNLPSFNSDVVATEEKGHFDHISITIPFRVLTFQNTQQYTQFRRDFLEHRITFSDRTSHAPKIRDTEWLFSGAINFRQPYPDADEGVIECSVTYDLSLNFSRFIHHAFQKLGRDIEVFSVETLEDIDTRLLLRKETIPTEHYSLDLGDNYIPHQIFKNVSPCNNFLRLYIESVYQFLNSHIERSYLSVLEDEPSDIDYRDIETDWVINDCEAYFEFAKGDALSFIQNTWSGFRSIFFNAENRIFPLMQLTEQADSNGETVTVSERLNRNCMALYADLGVEGLRLIVYAKTYKRIRFEVRYNKSIRPLFDGTDYANIGRDFNDIFTALHAYKVLAKERVQMVINALPDLNRTERMDYNDFAVFLTKLARMHQKYQAETRLDEILSILISNDGIVVRRNTNNYRLMECLEREFIVKKPRAIRQAPRGEQRYILNSRYISIIQAFRDVFTRQEE